MYYGKQSVELIFSTCMKGESAEKIEYKIICDARAASSCPNSPVKALY